MEVVDKLKDLGSILYRYKSMRETRERALQGKKVV